MKIKTDVLFSWSQPAWVTPCPAVTGQGIKPGSTRRWTISWTLTGCRLAEAIPGLQLWKIIIFWWVNRYYFYGNFQEQTVNVYQRVRDVSHLFWVLLGKQWSTTHIFDGLHHPQGGQIGDAGRRVPELNGGFFHGKIIVSNGGLKWNIRIKNGGFHKKNQSLGPIGPSHIWCALVQALPRWVAPNLASWRPCDGNGWHIPPNKNMGMTGGDCWWLFCQ